MNKKHVMHYSRDNEDMLISILMLTGLLAATALRVAVGGVSVAQSPMAGLIFAVLLIFLSLAAGVKTKLSKKIAVIGILGGLFLCLPALFAYGNSARPAGNYIFWSATVSIVALAEEYFFRGALYNVIQKWKGETVAILLSSLAFAALHIPLYGWHVLALDFCVGVWLGGLRAVSKSWIAPGIAHTLADLAGWWLR
jgi:membrane protease YdiL (CAAX protease family)